MSPQASALGLVLLLAGPISCAFNFGPSSKKGPPGPLSYERRPEDRVHAESRTLTALAALESALERFVSERKRAPSRLEDLVPRYIAEIPEVDVAVSAHAPSAWVEVYPPEALEGGAPEPQRLKHAGGWGYAPGASPPRVFVDCAHESSRGKPWRLERGAL